MLVSYCYISGKWREVEFSEHFLCWCPAYITASLRLCHPLHLCRVAPYTPPEKFLNEKLATLEYID